MHKCASLRDVLDDLAQYLEYEISEGVSEVEFSSDPLKALASLVPGAGPGQTAAPPGPARQPVSQACSEVRPAPNLRGDSRVEKELRRMAAAIDSCRRCSLHRTRARTVPGQGSPHPEIMFVGEGPGAEENNQGLPFVGLAGQLLTRMIEAMGYRREEVFIANIVKCQPPENRKPSPDEIEACRPYLREQIALLKPRVIVALGATAVEGLLGFHTGITRLRGKWQDLEGIPVMPTFHPSYLLRTPSAKREVWEDLQAVLKRLGRPVPEVKKKR